MNIDDYQEHAVGTVAITEKNMAALAHRALGLNGAAGILANQAKKVIRDKDGQADAQDLEIIRKRLGDVLYYAAALAEYYDLKLSDIAEQNMEQSTEFKDSRIQ